MQGSGYKQRVLAYGLFCAGTFGVFATAIADDHMHGKQTEAQQLSQEVKTFNENRGSLKEESAARSGAVGELESSTESSADAHAQHERADELSSEVNSYNQSGGSLNADSAASTELDDNTRASGHAAHGASAKSQELSKEIEEYNKNAE